MKVVVLGSGGMLGSMVLSELAAAGEFDVIATVRDMSARVQADNEAQLQWTTLDAEAATEADLVGLLDGVTWVVNAIGVIKPYIRDDDAAKVERAIRVNALFPHRLAAAAERTGAHVVQIATDCVYSGSTGRYTEDAVHDALDVYGKTKSLGEVRSPNVHHLRCSIIGPEPRAHLSLLDWFRGQPRGASLKGFTNHRWNGVTTLHFARICLGMVRHGAPAWHLHHLLPADSVSKLELLELFAVAYERMDLTISPVKADVVVDRTLATGNVAGNAELWTRASYSSPPSIAVMVRELASVHAWSAVG